MLLIEVSAKNKTNIDKLLEAIILQADIMELKANYKNVPSNIIQAIVSANSTRKDHITKMILKKNPKKIGIFKLAMKTNSDNFRSSSIIGILKRLKKEGIDIYIYEPSVIDNQIFDCKVIKNLNNFKNISIFHHP